MSIRELLEAIYGEYPRKVGKTMGMKKLEKQIKTQEDVEKLKLALKNYKQYLEDSEITEMAYVKHFSTWVTTWEDWLEYEGVRGELTPLGGIFKLVDYGSK